MIFFQVGQIARQADWGGQRWRSPSCSRSPWSSPPSPQGAGKRLLQHRRRGIQQRAWRPQTPHARQAPRSWRAAPSTGSHGPGSTPWRATPCLFLLSAAWRTPRATPHGRSPRTTPHAASWARPHPLPFAGPFAYGGYPAKAAILKGLLMRKHFDTVHFANVIS